MTLFWRRRTSSSVIVFSLSRTSKAKVTDFLPAPIFTSSINTSTTPTFPMRGSTFWMISAISPVEVRSRRIKLSSRETPGKRDTGVNRTPPDTISHSTAVAMTSKYSTGSDISKFDPTRGWIYPKSPIFFPSLRKIPEVFGYRKVRSLPCSRDIKDPRYPSIVERKSSREIHTDTPATILCSINMLSACLL